MKEKNKERVKRCFTAKSSLTFKIKDLKNNDYTRTQNPR